MIYTKIGAAAGPIDGYMAVGKSTARRLSVLSYNANVINGRLLTSQPTDPDYTVWQCAWGGNYLVVGDGGGLSNQGEVAVYERSGVSFTKLTVPSTFRVQYGDVATSSDGEWIAGCGSGSAGIWHNNSGTLTALSSVGSFSTNTRGCAVSSDGQYIAFLSASPFLRIKVRSGSGSTATYSDMTLASQPASGALAGTSLVGLAFSPDDAYLAVCPVNQANITVYKFNSSTSVYEQLASPFVGTLPSSSPDGCCFDSSGTLLAVQQSGNTLIYERSSDTFTHQATLTNGGRGSFNPNGLFYVTGNGRVYRRTGSSAWTLVETLGTQGTATKLSPSIL